MPRNVRNFWIELTIDGKKTRIATGPRGEDGGFELTIFQRNGGTIIKAHCVIGVVSDDGRLELHTVDDTLSRKTLVFASRR